MNARKPGRLLVLLVVVIGVVAEWHQTALLVFALGYLLSGVMARLAYSWKRRVNVA
jgi:CDP-diacylglycerol--serine O-phosphatidyltransferase